ncbi:MAG: membrane integrity-associated transporter subunit PqiC, partial [Desulfovibrio sp.]|nr:membrane integrity-associated transporter subunit PqiC [Desulfovibrio sp.]
MSNRLATRNWSSKLFPTLLLFCLALAMLGCGKSQPTHYYAFSGQPLDFVRDKLPSRTLRLARISIPQYLEREAIVQRSPNEAELKLDSLHIWAEPIHDGIRRQLYACLAKPLLEQNIALLPLASEDSGRTTLLVDILELNGQAGGQAFLSAQWSLQTSESNRLLENGLFASSKAVAGPGYHE